jgi:hypothetical protein
MKSVTGAIGTTQAWRIGMGLLLRLLGYLARLAFSILASLLLLLLRILLPVLRLVLGWLFRLLRTSIEATVSGPRPYIERRASERTRRLIELGVSREHFDAAYRFSVFTAASEIVLGWAIAFVFTVAALDLIF